MPQRRAALKANSDCAGAENGLTAPAVSGLWSCFRQGRTGMSETTKGMFAMIAATMIWGVSGL